MRTGMWILSPQLLRAAKKAPKDKTPVSSLNISDHPDDTNRQHCVASVLAQNNDPVSELYESYCSKDNVRFSLCGLAPLPTMRTAHKRLQKEACKRFPDVYTGEGFEFRTLALQHATYEQLDELLTAANIPHRKVASLFSKHKIPTIETNDFYMVDSSSYIRTDLCPDINIWVHAPFDFSCSNDHSRFVRRAPELGAHNDSILQRKAAFKVRPEGHPAVIPRCSRGAKTLEPMSDKPMSNVVIIELSGMGQSASGAATMCADSGATVLKILLDGKDPLDALDPHFGEQLNRGKTLVAVNTSNKNYASKIRGLIDDCCAAADKSIVFVSNLPLSELKKLGLNAEVLRSVHKSLVYVSITPFGPNSKEMGGDDRTAYLDASHLSDCMTAGNNLLPVAMPFLWGSMVATVHVKAAIDLALFHLIRTGEGQRCDLNLLRSGCYSNLFNTNLAHKAPELLDVVMPKMSFDCYKTKDGKWVQLLGVDWIKHVPLMLSAMGIKKQTYLRTFLKVLGNLSLGQTDQIVGSIFTTVSASLNDYISKYEWSDLQAHFIKHNVWHTGVATPEEGIRSEQARETLSFFWPSEEEVGEPTTARVHSPLQTTNWTSDTFVYGKPDSIKIVGTSCCAARIQLDDFDFKGL